MATKQADYFLGLDLGTNSVGFAVTDTNYQLLRANGKALWGVRLFDEAETAAKRRTFRSAARRRKRQVLRIKLLQDLFSEAIAAVDPAFFQRLKDSFFYPDDKTEEQKYSLFTGEWSDVHYHKRYPTIYHLRAALMDDPNPHDPRLVYLVCHHILKRRGHFLFPGEADFRLGDQLEPIWESFRENTEELLDLSITQEIGEPMLDILKARTTKRAVKEGQLMDLLGWEGEPGKSVVKLLLGYEVKFNKLFGDTYKDTKPAGVKFDDSGFEDDKYDEIATALPDAEFSLLNAAYALYGFARLSAILQGQRSYSHAKMEVYKKHHADLLRLKKVLTAELTKDAYEEYFNGSNSDLINYVAYSGHRSIKGKKQPVLKRVVYADFAKDLAKRLGALAENSPRRKEIDAILEELSLGTFLPKITSKDNSLVPHQIHGIELAMILHNASAYLPFLKNPGYGDKTVSEMIQEMLKFRIPYYVGPLNPAHRIIPGKDSSQRHAWVTRKSADPVRPWNFNEVVDVEQSALDFINNLTNKCTYLRGEDVLPKESPLYSRYMILNQLNTLTVNGERMPTAAKQALYTHFFVESSPTRVDKKAIAAFLRNANYGEVEPDAIGGMDEVIQGSLKGMKSMQRAANGKLTLEEAEEAARLITTLPDSGGMLNASLARILGEKLTSEEIKALAKVKLSGWGRLSRKLLAGITSPGSDGQPRTLITAMWEESLNLMELLSQQHQYKTQVDALNAELIGGKSEFSYRIVEEYPTSPSVKKMIWQALKVIREITKLQKKPPMKIFLEVAREEGEKKRTTSRKDQLKGLFRGIEGLSQEIREELESKSDDQLRSKKLYLYFTQLGKCMYSGEEIDLERLMREGDTTDAYWDIDHIYPRSLTKDDSITNNLVLAKKSLNQSKGDGYPIAFEIRQRMAAHWQLLKDKGLIAAEKYNRLKRNVPLTNEELTGFINRQLVETRQATKAVAEILKQVLPKADLVYVKAGHVSDFRYQQEGFRFPKSRGMNDLHHAKDAYLNIVVGNVFDTKFTRDPYNYVKQAKPRAYNLARMYDFPVAGAGGVLAWRPGEDGTVAVVQRVMARNDILCTWQTKHRTSGQSGGLFDQNILPPGIRRFPIKASDPRLASERGRERYGGYKNETGTGFFLVRHQSGKKVVTAILPLPLYWQLTKGSDSASLEEYCLDVLKLRAPEILVVDIPYSAILEMNGFPVRILAKTDSNLKVAPALQPYFPAEQEETIRLVMRAADNADEEKAQKLPEAGEMASLYEHLAEKLTSEPFNRLSAFANCGKDMLEHQSNFNMLEPWQQVKVLQGVINLMQCDGRKRDLVRLENAKPTDQKLPTKQVLIVINQNLKEVDEPKLLAVSATGVFTRKVQLTEGIWDGGLFALPNRQSSS